MELHSPVAAKRLWKFLRVAFYMIRKGLKSKRKLIMDMHLMAVKKRKLVGGRRKTSFLRSLIFHHQPHHGRPPHGYGFGQQEYEFSCSNSPNPVFFHAKRRHHYFPCINAIVEEPDDDDEPLRAVVRIPRIEFSPKPSSEASFDIDLASGPLLSPPTDMIRVSNYSWVDQLGEDEVDGEDGRNNQEVDGEAEEFIRRFYEQLHAQSRIALLQYQEEEYQDMLARGA